VLRLVVMRYEKGKARLYLALPFIMMEFYFRKTPPIVLYSQKCMSSLTVSKPKSKTVVLILLTPAELDEQAQLAHQEALWQDRCDYYQSAR
jgi:hypothetical protein